MSDQGNNSPDNSNPDEVLQVIKDTLRKFGATINGIPVDQVANSIFAELTAWYDRRHGRHGRHGPDQQGKDAPNTVSLHWEASAQRFHVYSNNGLLLGHIKKDTVLAMVSGLLTNLPDGYTLTDLNIADVLGKQPNPLGGTSPKENT